VVVMKSSLWDITLCSPLKVNQCFRGAPVDFQQIMWHYIQKLELFITSEVYTSVIYIFINTRKRMWTCLKYADIPNFIITLSTVIP
jgi:hypothetical protein